MFWLKKEALVKAVPPLPAKGPFPPHSSSEPPLAEAESEANEAASTGPWPHSWMFWDLPGKQLNSGRLFSIFIFNSLTRQFKKCISKTPQKQATVSYHFLCCLGGFLALLNLSRRDSEKSLGRGSIPNGALADSDVKRGAKGLSPAAWDLQRKDSFWNFFCK